MGEGVVFWDLCLVVFGFIRAVAELPKFCSSYGLGVLGVSTEVFFTLWCKTFHVSKIYDDGEKNKNMIRYETWNSWRRSRIVLGLFTSLQTEERTHLRTTTPWLVAAVRSILSTPVPARPTTRSDLAAAITSAVTFVSERTISPSYFCNNTIHYHCRTLLTKLLCFSVCNNNVAARIEAKVGKWEATKTRSLLILKQYLYYWPYLQLWDVGCFCYRVIYF